MRWRKRYRWKVGIAVVGLLLLLVLIVWVPVSMADAQERAPGLATPITGMVQATPTEDATVTALNKEKLTQEVQQLKDQNAPGLLGWLRMNAAVFLSTLVVVIGGLIGLFRWLGDQRDEQEKRREDQRSEQEKRAEEQQRWLEDRQAEREKRAEEGFQSVVKGLGSTSTAKQVGAAIMLRTFLRPGYEQFYSQAFDLAVAYLRLRDIGSEPETPDSLNQALIRVFRESFPLTRDLPEQSAQSPDALGIRLDRAYLARSDLRNARLPESYLREANLAGVNLSGANLRDANLTGANLDGPNLSGANLWRADFNGANLIRANLSGANLRDTKLHNVKSLTKEQLEHYKAKGAIIDDAPTTSLPLSPASPSTDGSIGLSSQQVPEP